MLQMMRSLGATPYASPGYGTDDFTFTCAPVVVEAGESANFPALAALGEPWVCAEAGAFSEALELAAVDRTTRIMFIMPKSS
jgi:hypothetical protein